MEFGEDKNPFYHLMSTMDEDADVDNTSVELVYPWQFLHRLCDTSLCHLKEYLTANELNPYDSFRFGTYWISELNR